jgi:hypothetical protein
LVRISKMAAVLDGEKIGQGIVESGGREDGEGVDDGEKAGAMAKARTMARARKIAGRLKN